MRGTLRQIMALRGLEVRGADVKDAELQLALAAMETKMRAIVTELVQPTVQRTSGIVSELESLKGFVTLHGRTLQEVQLGQLKMTEQVNAIATFRDELSKFDNLRGQHEMKVGESIENLEQRLEGFRYSLEQKESVIHQMNRSVDRIAIELNHVMEEQAARQEGYDARIDEVSRRLTQLRAELEVRFVAIEQKHHALTDQLWGEETGLAKVMGELKKTNARFNKMEDTVTKEQSKGEHSHFDKLRTEVAKMVYEANCSVAALKQSVGEVVNDVREHFHTASQTIAAHNATFVQEVRQQYQGELAQAARLRSEVQAFMQRSMEGMASLDSRVSEAATKAGSLAAEIREEVQELNKRRQRDKTSWDNELKALKKRLGGVFENSDAVLKGLEHLYGVLRGVLEGDLMQCSVELQDNVDRQRIALMGVKDEEATLIRSTHNEPQRARPECRARSAPGGPKPQGALKGGPGTMLSARGETPVVKLDNRCISCSAQSPLVLTAFKMACLHYTASPVEYCGMLHERGELLQKRRQILQRANGALLEGPRGGAPTSFGFSTGDSWAADEAKEPGFDAFADYAAVDARFTPRIASAASTRLPTLSSSAGFASTVGDGLRPQTALPVR